MRKLSNAELNRITKEQFPFIKKMPLVLVLDNIRSHLNVGSIFRSCDAFPVQAMYLCGITGTPPHRDIQKTALGATETVSWRYFQHTEEAVNCLKENHYTVVALEQAEGALSLQDVDKLISKAPLAFIIGNEVEGVAQQVVSMSDVCVEIPQHGTKHSLNVAVSAGILLWELSKHFLLVPSC
ncbi:MAG: RNA methyltransferase [Chitinophagales bacterium]|nr:RNA methyltransferase [Chitinophagales bacterium]MDW8273383.1 RNA methyltransferase [Chitinophagales bacterium]